MPWKEYHVVDERLRFIAGLLDGEKMSTLCSEFGISRKTGYKIHGRYKECGTEGRTDRSRRPHRYAKQLGALRARDRSVVRVDLNSARGSRTHAGPAPGRKLRALLHGASACSHVRSALSMASTLGTVGRSDGPGPF